MENISRIRDKTVKESIPGSATKRKHNKDVDNSCAVSPLKKISPAKRSSRKALSTMNVKEVPREAQKLLRSGAGKIRNAFDNVSQKLKPSTKRRHRLANSPTTPATPRYKLRQTPQRAKELLGRTPEEMNSPFGIETPNQRQTRNPSASYEQHFSFTPHENVKNIEPTSSLPLQRGKLRKSLSAQNFRRNLSARMSSISLTVQNAMGTSRTVVKTSQDGAQPAPIFCSPTQSLTREVSRIQLGVDEFQRVAQHVVRRSLRQQMLNAQ